MDIAIQENGEVKNVYRNDSYFRFPLSNKLRNSIYLYGEISIKLIFLELIVVKKEK